MSKYSPFYNMVQYFDLIQENLLKRQSVGMFSSITRILRNSDLNAARSGENTKCYYGKIESKAQTRGDIKNEFYKREYETEGRERQERQKGREIMEDNTLRREGQGLF